MDGDPDVGWIWSHGPSRSCGRDQGLTPPRGNSDSQAWGDLKGLPSTLLSALETHSLLVVELHPLKIRIKILTPSTSEWDRIWRWGLCRGHVGEP